VFGIFLCMRIIDVCTLMHRMFSLMECVLLKNVFSILMHVCIFMNRMCSLIEHVLFQNVFPIVIAVCILGFRS
jgi:hypothetical protein